METFLSSIPIIPPLSPIQFFKEIAIFLGNENQAYLIDGLLVEDLLADKTNIINAFPFEISFVDPSLYKITAKELWEKYQDRVKNAQKMERKKLETFDPLLSGFISKGKSNGKISYKPVATNYFPKNNYQQTHHISAPGTYIVDIMFSNPYTYLIMTNANTRFTRAEQLGTENPREAQNYLAALSKMGNPKTLVGDSEKAFSSKSARDYYQGLSIKFRPVVSKDNHKQLAIIDRVIRTLRDMVYKINPKTPIFPRLMSHILEQYNQVPHNTLTKILGFPCSPKMAEEDPEVEREIINRLRTLNRRIMSQPFYFLKPGTEVKIMNPKSPLVKRRTVVKDGVYRVKRQKGAVVEIEGILNPLPRTMVSEL